MKRKSNLLFILMLFSTFFNVQILWAQPPFPVTAPNTFSNPVVIVIPKGTFNYSPDAKNEVTIYYVPNNTGMLMDIVSPTDSLLSYAKIGAEMHVRGDATAGMPKQQFSVKLNNEPPAGNFLNMPDKGKDWVFNDCGAVDLTLMRNVITFNAQQGMGQYAPAWKWFELFICNNSASVSHMTNILNNYYRGLYLNFDKIEFASDRVNFPYSKDSVNGNYAILQLNQQESKYLTLNYSVPLSPAMQVYEPEKKDISTSAAQTLNNWYNSWGGNVANFYSTYVNDTTGDTLGKAASIKAIRNATDYQSFAVYFLLNELAKDQDGYEKSTFMVKSNNTCYAGPLWDKNKSYGNTAIAPDTTFYNDTAGWVYHNPANWQNPNQAPAWWYAFLADPVFCKIVWNTWTTQTAAGGLLTSASFNILIQNQKSYISTSCNCGTANNTALTRNELCWQGNNINQNQLAYNAQITQLETYISGRLNWMKANLPGLLQQTSGYKVPATASKAVKKKK